MLGGWLIRWIACIYITMFGIKKGTTCFSELHWDPAGIPPQTLAPHFFAGLRLGHLVSGLCGRPCDGAQHLPHHGDSGLHAAQVARSPDAGPRLEFSVGVTCPDHRAHGDHRWAHCCGSGDIAYITPLDHSLSFKACIVTPQNCLRLSNSEMRLQIGSCVMPHCTEPL